MKYIDPENTGDALKLSYVVTFKTPMLLNSQMQTETTTQKKKIKKKKKLKNIFQRQSKVKLGDKFLKIFLSDEYF